MNTTDNITFLRRQAAKVRLDDSSREPTQFPRKAVSASVGLLLCCALLGCRQDMHDQPKFVPLRGTTLFADGRSARAQVSDTVARSQGVQNDYFHTGMIGGAEGDGMPLPVNQALLERGQERFNIYCTPCHSRTGYGHGMIVQRGYLAAANFHTDRLREKPLGHFFAVMTNGYGAMPDYAAQLTPEDRWAVAAYIRALQLSQHATTADSGGTRTRPLTEIAAEQGFTPEIADVNFWRTPGSPAPLPAPASVSPAAAVVPTGSPAVGTEPAAAATSTATAGDHAATAKAPVTKDAAGKEPSGKDASTAPSPEAKPKPAKAAAGNAAEGKALYEAKCSMCHQPDLGGKPPLFPSLQGIIQRKGEEHARTTIVNGVPDARPMMPAFGDRITSADVDNLVAYLRTVKAQAAAASQP